MNQKISMNVL